MVENKVKYIWNSASLQADGPLISMPLWIISSKDQNKYNCTIIEHSKPGARFTKLLKPKIFFS